MAAGFTIAFDVRGEVYANPLAWIVEYKPYGPEIGVRIFAGRFRHVSMFLSTGECSADEIVERVTVTHTQ